MVEHATEEDEQTEGYQELKPGREDDAVEGHDESGEVKIGVMEDEERV